MNHRDREILGTLLDQLWDTRNGHPRQMVGTLNQHQLDLLAAAMRIVAGTNGPNLPNPWVTAPIWTANNPAPYAETPGWRDKLINWLART